MNKKEKLVEFFENNPDKILTEGYPDDTDIVVDMIENIIKYMSDEDVEKLIIKYSL